MSVLYQTLEDRDNINYVEANGPFPGNVRETWLGRGYYYWDTFINSAHFWGWASYGKYGKGYIIARSNVVLPPDRTLDLLNVSDLMKFASWVSEYERTFPERDVTVEKVLTHARKVMGVKFPYIAIRAMFVDSINMRDFQDRIYPNGKAYLDLQPPIQVCIMDRSIVGPDNFKVIYPEKYVCEDAYTF